MWVTLIIWKGVFLSITEGKENSQIPVFPGKLYIPNNIAPKKKQ